MTEESGLVLDERETPRIPRHSTQLNENNSSVGKKEERRKEKKEKEKRKERKKERKKKKGKRKEGKRTLSGF